MRLRTTPTRPALPLLAVATLALTLTACGTDGGEDSGGTAATSVDGSAAQPGAGATDGAAPARTMPGASGLVAAIDGTTLQVQSPLSGQVAVTYTDATTFTAQVAGSLGDVTVGGCVVVTPAEGSTDGTDAVPTEVTAGSVRIVSPAGDGGCGSGFGGGPGGAGGERPEGMPTDLPDDRPSGGPDGGTFVRATGGTVAAVTASGFIVESSVLGEDTATTVDVTVTGTTTYAATVASDPSALATGVCVTATGEADDTGAVTAETIGINEAVDGVCTVGFGMRGGAA